MGQRIREYDWSNTPLGPIQQWPQNLRTCIRIMLASRQPIWIGWGKELIKLYNDPYRAIVGGMHPRALGSPASVVWKAIWSEIGPMLRQVMEKDEGTYSESQLLIMHRNGYPEETYYTFSYTPIPGDDGTTAGMICANTDDTDRIISERQLKTLTQLGKRLTGLQSKEETIAKTIATLRENPYDFPFALFYGFADNKAILFETTGLNGSFGVIPKEIDLNTGDEIAQLLQQASVTRQQQVLHDLRQKIGNMPKGAWEVSPDKALVLPVAQAGAKEPYGFLVVGVNPYRLLDDKYSSFFSLVADQVATSFADVNLQEEERKRMDALAALDRAKTIFFSNISHEFRTPLTLLLGPIEDALHDPGTTGINRDRLGVAYRNTLRMQKLVNTLLDFSKIEAGRMDGQFTRVDIVTFTEDLVSTFRSAVEKAGMQLIFTAAPVEDNIYVDKEMWEKIVLNLVSNAFKYAKDGIIEVKITQEGRQFQLSVSDTGSGIPADQLEKIFDRFHRVENTQGRSQEGTGIGLAMVKELVKLHHGNISVSSEPGKGSIFIVTIPTGKEHLPADKIADTLSPVTLSSQTAGYSQEAMKWVPDEKTEKPTSKPNDSKISKYTVLLADDNTDMREYVERLLCDQFDVITAVDGEDAFDKMRFYKPDLLLSDIMMPRLDGFGLLRKIRNHPDIKNTPVILLSARAGEEAKLEGLDNGADDYLVKPFAAKELVARVDANIKIARTRLAAENNLRSIILQSPVAMCVLRGPQLVVEMINEKALEVTGKTYQSVINRPTLEAFSELVAQGFESIFQTVLATGKAFVGNEMPVTFVRNEQPEEAFFNFIYEPLKNSEGMIDGIIAVGIDVSEEVMARQRIEQSRKELNEMANAMPQLVWMANPAGRVIYFNNRIAEFTGAVKATDDSWDWEGLVHPRDVNHAMKSWQQSVETGAVFQEELRLHLKDGSYRWFLSRGIPQKDEQGNIVRWFGTTTDIHAAKEQANILEEEVKKRTQELSDLNNSLKQSNNDLQQFAHVASHDLKEPLRKIKTFTGRLADEADPLLSEKARSYIEKVNSATDRMNMMIEGVLSYSMLNATGQPTTLVDLNKIMESIIADLELMIAQKDVTIHYADLPKVEGAEVLLYQLFYNLINNSLKFSRPDADSFVSVNAHTIEKNGQLFSEIKIEDNGIGFEQAQADHIFETFARLNPKDRYEGTGLGLSLCRKIVQRHGGSITATGSKGEGAVFTVQLPLVQEGRTI